MSVLQDTGLYFLGVFFGAIAGAALFVLFFRTQARARRAHLRHAPDDVQ